MNKYSYTDAGRTYTRISRKAAEKAYNSGLPVIACPCNLRPGAPWHPETELNPATGAAFTAAENAFYFYNIRNAETGKYISWFIEEEKQHERKIQV